MNERTGEIVLGRCRATNLCRYCQALYVLETVEMLTLDALERAPTLWCVLTAREHLTRAECRRHLHQLLRSCRRRWPDIEWFVQVEFQRRGALHLNLLIKGVPADQLEELQEHLGVRWCDRVDAEQPWAVVVNEVTDGEGLVRYLHKTLSHGLKAEQAPPIGWRGHRTSQTRGYLVRPAAQMREQARAALRLKRELWRAMQAGHEGHDAELVAQLALQERAQDTWRLYGLRLQAGDEKPRPGAHDASEGLALARPARDAQVNRAGDGMPSQGLVEPETARRLHGASPEQERPPPMPGRTESEPGADAARSAPPAPPPSPPARSADGRTASGMAPLICKRNFVGGSVRAGCQGAAHATRIAHRDPPAP